MSALRILPFSLNWPTQLRMQAMRSAHLETVLAVERQAYAFPWTHENFASSIASGYLAECLFDPQDHRALLGYYVLQPGVQEMHLLNITVAPAHQGRGLGRQLMTALCVRCVQYASPKLWLEVRVSNLTARRMYEQMGFVQAGIRRAYYPATGGREDAIVMVLDLPPDETHPPSSTATQHG